MHKLFNILIPIGVFIVLLPVLVAYLKKTQLSKAQRLLALMLGIVAANQLVAFALRKFVGTTNLPLYHFYTLIESVLLLMVLQFRLKALLNPRFFTTLAILLGGFTIGNAIFIQGLFTLPTYSRTAEASVMVLLTGVYFYQVTSEMKIRQLERSFWFWLNSGLMVYFAGNLLLFIFSNILAQDEVLHYALWSIHAFFNIMLYIVYSIALLCKDPISSKSS